MPSELGTVIFWSAVGIAGAFLADGITRNITGKGILDHIKDYILDGLNKKAGTKEEIEKLPTIAGAKNQSILGRPIPLVLGTHLFAPYYCGNPYIEIDGEDGKDEYYRMSLCCGYDNTNVDHIKMGNIEIATNRNSDGTVKADGKTTFTVPCDTGHPLSTSGDIEIELVKGNRTSSIYPQKVYDEPFNSRLYHLKGENALEVNGASAVCPQKIEVQINIPALIAYRGDGEKLEADVHVRCMWSLDEQNWNYMYFVGGTPIENDSKPEFAHTTLFRRDKSKEMRFVAQHVFSYSELFDADGNFKNEERVVYIRILRTDEEFETPSKVEEKKPASCEDKVYLTNIRTWCFDYTETKDKEDFVPQKVMDAPRLAMTTRLSFKIKATETTKQYIDSVNCLVHSICPIYIGDGEWGNEQETSNPASIVKMLLGHKMLGSNKIEDSKIDLFALGKVYEYCERPYTNSNIKFEYNEVITSQSKLIEVINKVLRIGRSYVTRNGSQYSFFVDKRQTTPCCVLNNHNVLNDGLSNTKEFNQRIDGVRVNFINKTIGYQKDTRIAYRNGVSSDSADLNLVDIELEGCTDGILAWKYARFELAKMQLRPETWVRKIGTEANVFGVGNIISYQDDTILVGIGNGGIIKDLILNDAGDITAFRIDTRLEITDASKTYGATIQHSSPTTDVSIYTVELDFENEGYFDLIPLVTPLTSNSVDIGDLVSFGELGKVSTDVLCISKTRDSDGNFTCTFLPYSEEIFDYDENENMNIPDFNSNVTSPTNSIFTEREIQRTSPTLEDVVNLSESANPNAIVQYGSRSWTSAQIATYCVIGYSTTWDNLNDVNVKVGDTIVLNIQNTESQKQSQLYIEVTSVSSTGVPTGTVVSFLEGGKDGQKGDKGDNGSPTKDNLLKNSNFVKGYNVDGWGQWGSPTSLSLANDSTYGQCVKCVMSANQYQGSGYTVNAKPNTTYSISSAFWSGQGAGLTIGIHCRNSGNTILSQTWIPTFTLSSSQWERKSLSFTTPANTTNLYIMIGGNVTTNNGKTAYWTNVKLEENIVATAWTLHPTEMKGDKGDKGEQGVQVNTNLQDGNKNGSGTSSWTSFSNGIFQLHNWTTTEKLAYFPNNADKVSAGKQYTISFEAKQDGNMATSSPAEVYYYGDNYSTTGYITSKGFAPTTDWQKFTHTFTITAGRTLTNMRIRFDNNATKSSGTLSILYIRNVKFEEGGIATSFCYSVKDTVGDSGTSPSALNDVVLSTSQVMFTTTLGGNIDVAQDVYVYYKWYEGATERTPTVGTISITPSGHTISASNDSTNKRIKLSVAKDSTMGNNNSGEISIPFTYSGQTITKTLKWYKAISKLVVDELAVNKIYSNDFSITNKIGFAYNGLSTAQTMNGVSVPAHTEYHFGTAIYDSDYIRIGDTSNWTNTAIGYEAGKYVSGGRNIAIGKGALKGTSASSKVTGTANIAIGNGALPKPTSGNTNVAIGDGSLGSITTGSKNVCLGGASGLYITTGTDNVGIGSSALYQLTSGSYNVCIGSNAGFNLTNGNVNIAIGYNVNFSSVTASNEINIGNKLRYVEFPATATQSSVFSAIETITNGAVANKFVSAMGRIGTPESGKNKAIAEVLYNSATQIYLRNVNESNYMTINKGSSSTIGNVLQLMVLSWN